MQRLLPEQYETVLPLIRQSEIRSHLACAHAVLEGRQGGTVLADSMSDPQCAFVLPVSGFFFAFGDPTAEAARRFLPALCAEHLVDKAVLLASSAAWRETLDALLPHRETRLGFTYRPEAASLPTNWRDRVPEEFLLEPMGAGSARQWQRGLDPWVMEIWGGAERFARHSFGVGLTRRGKLVSIAAALAIGGGEAEVEVGTVPGYQRQGLATITCAAFLQQCVERGLTPAWSCALGNEPSLALGRKLGFIVSEEITGYPLVREATQHISPQLG